MNDFNFIKGAPVKKQLEFCRWYKITTLLILCTLIFIIILHVKELYVLQKLKRERNALEECVADFDNIVKQKNQIKNEQKKSQNQSEKFQNLLTKPGFKNYLIDISKTIPENAYLQSLEYDSKNGMNLKGYSTNVQASAKFVENLKKLEFIEDIKIECLKSKEDYAQNLKPINEFHIFLKIRK